MPPDYLASEAFDALVMVEIQVDNGYGKVVAAGKSAGLARGQRVLIRTEPLFRYMERPIFHASQLQLAR